MESNCFLQNFSVLFLTCNNNFSSLGFFKKFRRILRFYSNKSTRGARVTYNSKMVYVYDLFGNLNTYSSLSICAQALNISRKTISRYLDSGLRFHNYIFSSSPVTLVTCNNTTNYDHALFECGLVIYYKFWVVKSPLG